MRRVALLAGGGGSLTLPPPVNPFVILADVLGYIDDGFTKDAGNPILPKGAGGAFDDFGVRELCPVTDENGLLVEEVDGLWGYYAAFADNTGTAPWKIGLAKSADLGETWVKDGELLGPAGTGWYQNDITQPSVVKLDDGTFVMIATGRDSGDVLAIGCLTSTDGETWADAGVKLELGDFLDGATAIAEIAVPHLIKRSAGDWLCIVECRTSGITNGWREFGAIASDPTGTWTPLNSGQPLLSPTGAGWESVGVANMHLIEAEAGVYLAMYNGISASTGWQIGFAHSTNLTSWTRLAGNPYISKGTSGQWDDQQTEATFVFKEPGATKLRVLYQGFDDADGSMQVGLAATP